MGGNTLVHEGDSIVCNGLKVTIGEIVYQDECARDGERDVEFVDTRGWYRHWKQHLDGGYVIRKGDMYEAQ